MEQSSSGKTCVLTHTRHQLGASLQQAPQSCTGRWTGLMSRLNGRGGTRTSDLATSHPWEKNYCLVLLVSYNTTVNLGYCIDLYSTLKHTPTMMHVPTHPYSYIDCSNQIIFLDISILVLWIKNYKYSHFIDFQHFTSAFTLTSTLSSPPFQYICFLSATEFDMLMVV